MKLSTFLEEIRDEFGEEQELNLRVTTDPDLTYNAIAVVIEGKDGALFLSFPGHTKGNYNG